MKNIGLVCLAIIIVSIFIQATLSDDNWNCGFGHNHNSAGLMQINNLMNINRSELITEKPQSNASVANHGLKQFYHTGVKEENQIQSPNALDLGRTLSINGTVFNDQNGNGFRDAGEAGVSGWTIRLMRRGVEIKNIKTDISGHYSFGNLTAYNYTISEDRVAGWNLTTPGTQSYNIVLTDKDAYHIDFGNHRPAKTILASEYNEFPVMKLTPEKSKEMQEQYDRAPRFKISPQPKTEGTRGIGENFWLLPYLTYNAKDRNQGNCANCWVWAGTGAMEIDMAVRYGIRDRLSIQWFDSNYQDACCTGLIPYFAEFYGSKPGQHPAIPWSNSNASFQDGNDAECSSSISADTISTIPCYLIGSCEAQVVPTTGIEKEAAISNIKKILKLKKPVVFTFILSPDTYEEFKDFWANKSENDIWSFDGYDLDYWYGSHAVLCIGYDDTDPPNRHWIMVNSWPTQLPQCPKLDRPRNIFNVSMDMDYNYIFHNPLNGTDMTVFEWWTLAIESPPTTPTAPSGPSSGLPKTSYSYSTSSTDPDGDQVKYTFDWGDNTPTSDTGWVSSGTIASVSHSWDRAGIYHIKAYATDSSGLPSGWSRSLRVLIDTPPKTPTTPTGPNLGKPDRTYSYSTSATDPDKDNVRYTFDWGDGNTSTTSLVNSGTTLSESHKWATAGIYRVKALVTDSWNVSSGWSSPLIVSIENDSIGIYRSSDHFFYLDTNNNRSLDPSDVNVSFGKGGDVPVVGDWNGDSIDELGVFRPSTATFYLDTNANRSLDPGDAIAKFGQMGDLPVTGDWNGDGTDKIGIFRRGMFYLDTNGNRAMDSGDVPAFNFGRSGDLPIAGDWNGDSKDEIGVFRPDTGVFYLDCNGNRTLDSGEIIANFGKKGDTPVAGDWNGDGKDEIGVLRAGNFYLDYNGDGSLDAGDVIATFGFKGDMPVAGIWG